MFLSRAVPSAPSVASTFRSITLQVHSRGSMPATVNNLVFLVNSAREIIGNDFIWSVCAAGRHQFTMGNLALLMGGNTRVGLEDNIYYSRGVLAETNAQFVDRIVRISREYGREIATPAEARDILSIKG